MSENMQQCPSCGELVPIEYVICVWCGFDLTAEHIRRSGIKIGKKEAFERMKNIVKDPFRTSKEISLIPDLTGGKLIFYFIAFIMTLNMLAVFGKIDGVDFNETEYYLANISLGRTLNPIQITFKFVIGIAFLIVQPVVLYLIFIFLWKYAAKLILLLTRSIGGFGDVVKIRSAIGYSMFPVLIGWIISYFLTLFAGHEILSGSIEYNDVSNAILAITREGVGKIGFFFIIIGWLWAIVLSVITMRQAAKLSTIESIIVSGIPTAFFMVVVVFGTTFLST